MSTKYERYQDYVIRDGKFVGEFEEMYQDFADPWEQTTREQMRSEKTVALNLIKKYQFQHIVELGCGFGHFTNDISRLGVSVTGVDVSPTASQKAKKMYPHCNFIAADILEVDKYLAPDVDVIIMSEITWYVLDKLNYFLEILKKKRVRPLYLLHLLATYPKGEQRYGVEKFTCLQEILQYFSLDYEEYGEIYYKDLNWCARTYFLGKL